MPALISEAELKPRVELTQSISQSESSLQNSGQAVIYFAVSNKRISIPGVYENSIYLTAPDNEVQLSNVTSRKGLTESVTQPSRNNFIKQKLEDLYQLYTKLGYQNEAVLEIGSDIIKDSLLQKKLDIKISRTGENEILIFRETEGTFNNIIIDEDADIEYLHIPLNRSETYNEHYSFVDNFDTFALASKL
jgi:hypothetical protein